MAYLLNDNSRIQGPWFDSMNWLQRARPHTKDDLGSILWHNPFDNLFEVQVFLSVDEASDWLRDCRLRAGT